MKRHALLAVSVAVILAACTPAGGDSSSSGGSSSSPDSSSSHDSSSASSSQSPKDIFIESGWPEKDADLLASIFLDHLYPFYDFGKLGYSYTLNTYEESSTMVSAHLEIASFPFEQVKAYLSAMTSDTGFIDKTEDYNVPEGEYVIEKAFSDYSLISASFYIADESGSPITEGNGTFNLDIHPARIAKEAWLGGDIEDYVSELLEKDIILPTPTSPATRYISSLDVAGGVVTPSLYFIGVDARESYGADLVSSGWKKVPLADLEEGSAYYISPDESVRAIVSLVSPSSPLVTTLAFQKAEYFMTYPEAIVNDCLDMIFLTSKHLSIPVPKPEGTAYYYVNDVLEIGGFFEIYVYGADCSDAYEKQLEEAGFHLVNYDASGNQFYYADEAEALFIYAYRKEDTNCTNITVGRNGKYFAGWPEQKANRMTESIGGETMLPVDGDAAYTTVNDYTSTSGDFSIFTKNLDEKLNFIDTTERYKALLNASDSGWTYDEIEDRWHDQKGKLSVSLRFYEQEGLQIHVEPYIPSVKELSEEELVAAFSGIGVSDYSFVSVDGAKGYSLVTGEGSFSIIAWGMSETSVATYEQKLSNNGHSFKTAGGTPYYFDSSKKASFTMDYDDEEGLLTIVFQSYASRFNYSSANLASYVANIQKEYDSAFTLPAIPCGESTEGIMRVFEQYGFVTFSIAIFELGFLDELRTALQEDGWVKSETSDKYFFKTGNALIWTIYLYEDVENNYTDIDISGKE